MNSSESSARSGWLLGSAGLSAVVSPGRVHSGNTAPVPGLNDLQAWGGGCLFIIKINFNKFMGLLEGLKCSRSFKFIFSSHGQQ